MWNKMKRAKVENTRTASEHLITVPWMCESQVSPPMFIFSLRRNPPWNVWVSLQQIKKKKPFAICILPILMLLCTYYKRQHIF